LKSIRNSLLTVSFFILLGILCAGIIYFISTNRLIYGLIALTIISGIGLLIIAFTFVRLGFIFTFLLCSFIFLVERLVGLELPFGIARDVLLIVIFVGIFVEKTRLNQTIHWSVRNPITIFLIFYTLYLLLQFFNPNGTLQGWLFGIRGFLSYILIYIILVNLFDDFKFIILFTKLWIVIALFAAVYCLYQEFVGLPGYDLKWVTSNDIRIGLNFIQGRWRKWSFLSDVGAFGLFMAFGGVFCIAFGLDKLLSMKVRFLLLLSGLVMLWAMVYSGTRTAFAIVPIGLLMYVLLTVNQKATLILVAVLGIVSLLLLFGPFQGKTLNRIRSAFNPQHDASMLTRDLNRSAIQPYIHSHPIGGGIVTTGLLGIKYSPDHELAGFPPDSGFLETTLELGWIGLAFQLGLYFIVLYLGVLNYYSSNHALIRTLYLSYICGFFALSIGNYAKASVNQLPIGIIIMAVFALMSKLKHHDSSFIRKDSK